MSQTKRTYALPAETMTKFEAIVPAGERSQLVGQLLSKWLEEKERLELRENLAEACREMADVYLEIEKEFNPLEEEVHRALGDETQTRRRGTGKAQSHRRVGTSR